MEKKRCYVGFDETTQNYSVACDSEVATAREELRQEGFLNIVFGPAEWGECVAYLEDRGVKGW